MFRLQSLPTPWLIFVVYVAAISILSVLACLYDKLASKTGKVKFRLPEKTLFVWSLLGGSVAMLLTMLLIRHKTKHLSFMLGIPLIIALQGVGVWLLIKYGVLPL